MIDTTIHIGDLIVAGGLAIGGWRMAVSFRDEMRGLRQTVYGSKEPPVEGLVSSVERLEHALDPLASLSRMVAQHDKSINRLSYPDSGGHR